MSYKDFRPGSSVALRSGGPKFTVITDQEWFVACMEKQRPDFIPCVAWIGDESYYVDLPASALIYVDAV